jgi:transcriptional regulator with PAS, ATPase and Fis domain
VVQDVRAPGGGEAAVPRTSGRVSPSEHPPVVLDPAMRRLFELGTRVARGTISVLLVGETGTGKEVLAELVHRHSPRAAGPLVRVNCAAFADGLVESELFGHEKGAFTGATRDRAGLLESADGGTVVLDEVGEMAPALQAKLLRVLEEKAFRRVGGTGDITVDVRIIAATNRDLEERVRAGKFRDDLFYRLNVLRLELPPLRARREDIPRLAQYFIEAFRVEFKRSVRGLSAAAQSALSGYAWPGNVRELRNLIERAVLLSEGEVLQPGDFDGLRGVAPLPVEPGSGFSLPAEGVNLEDVEKQLVTQALERTGGNQTRAAALLGLHRDQIRYRIEKFGLRQS